LIQIFPIRKDFVDSRYQFKRINIILRSTLYKNKIGIAFLIHFINLLEIYTMQRHQGQFHILIRKLNDGPLRTFLQKINIILSLLFLHDFTLFVQFQIIIIIIVIRSIFISFEMIWLTLLLEVFRDDIFIRTFYK